ncbi:hypothetical protein Pan216_02200 [Planctomycetes bacterium Pan216]|uniref:UPF0102 protein Pan216_02200 n=1 Tax=Kolteria novifilia TaxID=2527975 RepID=A0A518AXD7_9BACT|nr:hypothetical protein Pan216_02200 [Planctomycetes bacterium Pan216]
MPWFRPHWLGRRGERIAGSFLKRRGYRILARSFRSPLGEIDLICLSQGVLVFVEVKTRSSAERGEPWEAVDRRKQRRITRAAVGYAQRAKMADRPIRFDIIAITLPDRWWEKPRIDHFEDAFEAQGPWSL